jgi:hypothetical protein
LYVFTKNWGDYKTNIYSCPKTKGNYSLTRIGSANTMGMVTGATYNPVNNMVVLCGYSFIGSFIAKMSNLTSPPFYNIEMERFSLELKQSIQIEGIAYANNNKYYLSSEAFQGTQSLLHKIETDKLLTISPDFNKDLSVYPNPFKDYIKLPFGNYTNSQVLDSKGKVVIQNGLNNLRLSALEPGVYYLRIVKEGKYFISKIIKE